MSTDSAAYVRWLFFDTIVIGRTSANVRLMSRRRPAQIGQEVVRLRDAKGMTRAALSRASGVSDDALSNLEHGRFKRQPHTLPQVAEALGVEVSSLIYDDARPSSAGHGSGK